LGQGSISVHHESKKANHIAYIEHIDPGVVDLFLLVG